ncbi:MAG: DUF1338 domain-containing protein [Bacteriovoracaceae bacterium]|jgi:hypothetical protein|nr:succinyldiaminopimelate aminotransferase [Halobacteriovoraceae bacterium]MDP7320334.1 DUF1338 domain-containing protein [Bacteriovoracaceae bacterium]
MFKIEHLFKELWEDYIKLIPQAQKIVNLLEQEGEEIINDHIALRTFNIGPIRIDDIAKPFIKAGYEQKGEYHFEEKKLFAKHFEHHNKNLPKVFISELILEEFSMGFQDLIKQKIGSVESNRFADPRLMVQGRPWELSLAEYKSLLSESEYGAWVAAHGFRPNHFTIFINKLKKFKEIKDLNHFLKENGFELNTSGGEIKGGKEVCLEQSSTKADSIEVDFSDGKMIIPSCYFEFAKRYPQSNGELYQGFVAKSADKIFESTNQQ